MKVKRTIDVEPSRFEIGDKIYFDLINNTFHPSQDETIEAVAVKEINGNMLFITTEALKKKYPMYDKYNENGYGDYETSDLRKHLNSDILDRFPTEIKERMVAFDNKDYIRIPTEKEMFGTNGTSYGCGDSYYDYCKESEDTMQFEYMKSYRNRMTYQGYDPNQREQTCHWVSNKRPDSLDYFVCVDWDGTHNCCDANTPTGVRPVFMLRMQ